jgi:hypothetical protein
MNMPTIGSTKINAIRASLIAPCGMTGRTYDNREILTRRVLASR